MTNYFLQHYIASSPKGDSWEEIDEQSGMKVTAFTYITLFLNDQVYANLPFSRALLSISSTSCIRLSEITTA